MQGVLTGFGVIALVIAVGYLVGRLEVLGPGAGAVLSRLTFFVATPALLLTTLADSDVRDVLSSALLVTAVSTTVVAAVFAAVAGGLWRRRAQDVTIGALSSTYVNAGNLGIPVAVYVLGDASYMAPVLLFQLLVMAPVGFAVLDSRSPRERRSRLGVVTQPMRNPVTLACGLGLALSASGQQLPELVLRPVELVGATAVPVALIAYGLSLHGAAAPGSGELRRDIWLAVLLKTAVMPAVAYLFARFGLGLDGTPLLASTLSAALPTAQNIYVYAVRYAAATVLARDCVLLTTVLSVPVLVAVAALVS